MSMENSSDTIGNRTRDIPAWSAMPQLIASSRAPLKSTLVTVFTGFVLIYPSEWSDWIRNIRVVQDVLLAPLWCFVMHNCARRVLLSIVNTTCHIPSCLRYATLLVFLQWNVFVPVLFKLLSLSETWQTPPSAHLFLFGLWLQLNTSSSYSVFRYWIYLWMRQINSTRISYVIEFLFYFHALLHIQFFSLTLIYNSFYVHC
jgi:hypothetical protein